MSGTVLVAEDDPAVRRVVVESLTRAGLTVRAAADGAEAMDMLHGGPVPDLVITDVRMPRVSGPELVRAARGGGPRLRVLFVSGHTGDDTPEGFLQAGDRLLGQAVHGGHAAGGRPRPPRRGRRTGFRSWRRLG